jgi:hypothetical protein
MKMKSKKASPHAKEHAKVQSVPISQYLKKSAAKELAKPPEFPRLVHSGK